MIKAIVFDFFGVLMTDGWLKFLDTYVPSEDERMRARELNHAAGRGSITYDQFIYKASDIGGVDVGTLTDMLTKDLEKNDLLLSYIAQLKENYKVSILSNVARADALTRLLSPDNVKLFDDILPSIEVGMIKPDPQIYKLAAHRLGVEPSECVFVDDRQPYAEAALGVGMKTVWYKDFNSFKSQLEEILAHNPAANN